MDQAKKLILDVDESPKKVSQWIILAIQHVLAMFVACITVPLLVFSGPVTVGSGFSNAGSAVPYINLYGTSLAQTMIAPTLVSAGIGTLIYIILTKMKSPVFLASSFAYIAPMCGGVALGAIPATMGANGVAVAAEAGQEVIGYFANLWALPIGMAMVGFVYVIVAIIIRFAGVNWLNKLLPTVVIGPVIMVIGLGLSTSAVNNLMSASGTSGYNLVAILCGLIGMAVTALCAHYGKKTLSLIPFVMGMLAGYVAAAIFTGIGYYGCKNEYFHIIDFSPIVDNFSNIGIRSFLDVPSFIFMPENFQSAVPVTGAQIGSIALLFIPVSLVTICEHIGDHKNLSGIIDRDLLTDPGLSRTLLGDGLATAASGLLCGAANTTYGENVAVVGVTKIASVKVIILACVMSILLGFLSPIMCVVETIPACVTGGVSLLLYGFIAASGVKMLINEQVDMSKTKNIFVASVILVSGIGGLILQFAIPSSGTTITITSTAFSMILGILMNIMLREKKENVVANIEEEKKEGK